MKSLLSMVVLICSLLTLQGCAGGKHVAYDRSVEMLSDLEDEEVDVNMMKKQYCEERVIEVTLDKENEGSSLLAEEVNLVFQEKRYTKIILSMTTPFTGFATGTISLIFDNGETEIINLVKMSLERPYRFVCNMPSHEIVSVKVELTPCEGTISASYILGGGNKDVTQVGVNTLLCNKEGLVLLYDEKMVIVDTVEMIKGEKYATNFGIKYYSYVRE